MDDLDALLAPASTAPRVLTERAAADPPRPSVETPPAEAIRSAVEAEHKRNNQMIAENEKLRAEYSALRQDLDQFGRELESVRKRADALYDSLVEAGA